MAKCPKCGVEVDYLINQVRDEHTYVMTLVNGVALYQEHEHRWDPEGQGKFICPECNEVLFQEEEAAVAFLMG